MIGVGLALAGCLAWWLHRYLTVMTPVGRLSGVALCGASIWWLVAVI